MAGEALDLGDVSLIFLDNVGVSTRYKGVMATTLSLSFVASGTSLVILVLLVSLALIGGLPTRRVSRGKISGFSLSEVFFLLLSGPVPLKTPYIHLAGIRR